MTITELKAEISALEKTLDTSTDAVEIADATHELTELRADLASEEAMMEDDEDFDFDLDPYFSDDDDFAMEGWGEDDDDDF